MSLAGLSACQSEELVNTEKEGTLEFYTSTKIDTRTSLQDGKTVVWNQGDAIAVYDFAAPKHRFEADIEGGVAYFRGNITPKYGSFIAAYPYENASENTVNKDILMRLPSEQTAVADGFGPGLNLSVAKGERNLDGSPSEVRFRNVCQLFKLEIPANVDNRITKIQLTAETGIAGEMTIAHDDHNPMITVNSGSPNTIALLPPSGTTAFAQGTYYMVAAPVQVKGFTLTLTDTQDKVYTQHSSSTVGGVWGVIYNLGTVDLIDKPTVTANHYYEGTVLKGTNLSLTSPTSDKAWSAVVKNAQGETVRTLASGSGTLTSDYTDANWPYLPVGTYTVDYTYTTANDKQMNASTTFQITERPQFTVTMNAASPHTYYSGDEVKKDVDKANSMDKNQVTEIFLAVNGIDLSILNNENYSYSVSNSFGGIVSSKTGNKATFDDISITQLGENTLNASATFDGVIQSDDKKVWITGLPFLHNPPSLDVWSKSGDITSNDDGSLRFGNMSTGDQILTFNGVNIPIGTSMTLDYHFYCHSTLTQGTTFTISAGNETWASGSVGYNEKATYESTIGVMNNYVTTQIICKNSFGTGITYTDLYRIGLSYAK